MKTPMAKAAADEIRHLRERLLHLSETVIAWEERRLDASSDEVWRLYDEMVRAAREGLTAARSGSMQ